MSRRFVDLLPAAALMLASGACTAQAPAPVTSSSESRPADASQADVVVYDARTEGIPVTARHPSSVRVLASGSGEGVGVTFSFAPEGTGTDGAELHVFLPAGAASAADQKRFVTGPDGLMASNRWTTRDVTDRDSARSTYDWVREVLPFTTDADQSGRILLGEAHGQAIQATELYPAGQLDEFEPAVTSVLQSLAFDEQLLPIRASGL